MKYAAQTNPDIKSPKFFYLVESITRSTHKIALVHWLTSCQRPVLTNVPDNVKGADFIIAVCNKEETFTFNTLYTVHIPKKEDSKYKDLELSEPSESHYVYGVVPQEKYMLLIKIADGSHEAPFHVEDEFYITDGMIANYKENTPLLTDVGKFLANYVIFASTVGDLVPYVNEMMSPKMLDKKIAPLIINKQITRKEYSKYIDHGYWLLSQGAIYAQSFSEKALTTSPEAIKKKHELMEKYKDKLDDPNTIVAIEAELIAADKAYLKGDPSEPFLVACGGKVFKEVRKKMFLTYGLSAGFLADDGYEFSMNNLEEGWNPENLIIAMNEIRKGSYNRSVETAKGGAESKFIVRIFQEVMITEDDCGDKQGIDVLITKDNVESYVDRYTVDGNLISAEQLKNSLGKILKIRSPMSCKCANGFCYKCCGRIYEQTRTNAIGVQSLAVTETFTNIAMAAMHVSGIGTAPCEDFDEYVI